LSLTLVAAACSEVDIEQARDCEVLIPALEEPAATVEILRREADPTAENAVVIHYRSRGSSGPAETHWVACRFGGADFARDRRDLKAVATDRDGAFSEIRLQILRRFWLSSVESQAAVQPVAPDAAVDPLLYLLQQIVNALVVCSLYGLLAVAYTLVYGIIGRINLAFGELSMIGAFATLLGVALFAVAGGVILPLALLAALAFAMSVSALYGWATERVVFRPLRGSASQAPLIATIGLAVFLQEYVRLAQGSRDYWLQPVFSDSYLIAGAGDFPVLVTLTQILIVGLTAGLYAAHRWLVEPSGFGLAWQACAQDTRMAALCGVDVDRPVSLTFVLGGAYAASAGFMITLYYGGVNFHMGTLLGFKALTAAIVGGIGSVPGALLGGILIGLLETFWSGYLTVAYKDVAVFGLLAVVLALRPEGLLGKGRFLIG
jgi:branched-chain amino acid transport system permease protein